MTKREGVHEPRVQPHYFFINAVIDFNNNKPKKMRENSHGKKKMQLSNLLNMFTNAKKCDSVLKIPNNPSEGDVNLTKQPPSVLLNKLNKQSLRGIN